MLLPARREARPLWLGAVFFLGMLEVQVFRSTSVHGLDEFDFFKLKRALSLMKWRSS